MYKYAYTCIFTYKHIYIYLHVYCVATPTARVSHRLKVALVALRDSSLPYSEIHPHTPTHTPPPPRTFLGLPLEREGGREREEVQEEGGVTIVYRRADFNF